MKTTKANGSEMDALKALIKHTRVMGALGKQGLAEQKASGKTSAKTRLGLKKALVEYGRLIRGL